MEAYRANLVAVATDHHPDLVDAIPPLPGKKWIGNHKPEVLEARAAALSSLMAFVSAEPTLAFHIATVAFLQRDVVTNRCLMFPLLMSGVVWLSAHAWSSSVTGRRATLDGWICSSPPPSADPPRAVLYKYVPFEIHTILPFFLPAASTWMRRDVTAPLRWG